MNTYYEAYGEKYDESKLYEIFKKDIELSFKKPIEELVKNGETLKYMYDIYLRTSYIHVCYLVSKEININVNLYEKLSNELLQQVKNIKKKKDEEERKFKEWYDKEKILYFSKNRF